MAEPRIPTMPCPECAGLGSFYDRPEPCERCGETGRVERPPLTPDQIAALPDGALVVIQRHGNVDPIRTGVVGVDRLTGERTYAGHFRLYCARVWLAEDAEP